MWHLFFSRLSFAPDAVIGVSLIVLYFVWVLAMSVKRIRQAEHMHH